VRTIQDKRKENNLKVGDMVDLVLPESLSAEEKEVVESMKKQLLSECHLKDISYGPELKITK
jgi:hypothetical protein